MPESIVTGLDNINPQLFHLITMNQSLLQSLLIQFFFCVCNPLCFAVGFWPSIANGPVIYCLLYSKHRGWCSFSGGFYSSPGAGRLLVKESIWLDSLTNCIKRQSCPWSAPQLIDGSTHLRRKSSRQNGDKSVARFLLPTLPCYLPTFPIFPSLCLFSHRTPRDCNVFQNKVRFSSNLYVLSELCIGKTQTHSSDTLYVNLQWEVNDSEFVVRLLQKLKKPFCVDEMKLNPAVFLKKYISKIYF